MLCESEWTKMNKLCTSNPKQWAEIHYNPTWRWGKLQAQAGLSTEVVRRPLNKHLQNVFAIIFQMEQAILSTIK